MKEGPYFVFPDGGTMFPEGSVKYIEKLGQYIPTRRGILRTALDMGCGVGTAILFQFLVYVFFFFFQSCTLNVPNMSLSICHAGW